jgi:hypothetical protein
LSVGGADNINRAWLKHGGRQGAGSTATFSDTKLVASGDIFWLYGISMNCILAFLAMFDDIRWKLGC